MRVLSSIDRRKNNVFFEFGKEALIGRLRRLNTGKARPETGRKKGKNGLLLCSSRYMSEVKVNSNCEDVNLLGSVSL